MRKKIDLLLVARPDHSIQIYRALLEQKELKFIFLSFKVFPKWIKKLCGLKKMTTVTKNSVIAWRLTFINLCRFNFKFGFAQKWKETTAFDHRLRTIFSKRDISIIHYWPEYGDVEIQKYIKSHSGVIAFADIHMPHPQVVFEGMKSVYKKYDIDPLSTPLARMVSEQCSIADNATDIIVPSSYVADTYRKVYKDKRYHIIPYGFTVCSTYERHHRNVIKEFVYAGRISLEKGSDILLEYFSRHPELNIHLYGRILDGQENVFTKYKQYRNIIFHGSVPKMELQEHLKHYDVGIHLSRFDAYSLAVGEMIGSGLPVIVSDYTGNKDDIEKENLGLVTTLDLSNVDTAVKAITRKEIYDEFVSNIDTAVKTKNKSYGERMIEFYTSKITDL